MSSTEAKVVLGLQLGNFEGNAKRAEKALADVGRTGQASAGQIRNATRQLPAQFTDIATSLAGGQNPFLVLLQQGGQIRDSFGSVGEAVRGIAGALNPVALAIGTVAAGAAGFAVAAFKGRAEAQQLRDTLQLTGNAAGLTASRFDQVAASIQAASRQSNDGARSIALALAGTGKVTGDVIESQGKVIARIADLSGQAGEKLASSFAAQLDAPAKFAAKLNETYNFLNVAQFKRIQQLEKEGKAGEAVNLTNDILLKSLGKQKQELDALAVLLPNVGMLWAGFWRAVKDAATPDTTVQKIEGLRKQLANILASTGGQEPAAGTYSSGRIGAIRAQIQLLAEQAKQETRTADATSAAAETNRKAISDLAGGSSKGTGAELGAIRSAREQYRSDFLRSEREFYGDLAKEDARIRELAAKDPLGEFINQRVLPDAANRDSRRIAQQTDFVQDLVDANERASIQLINDERARGEALIELDRSIALRRIRQAELTGQALADATSAVNSGATIAKIGLNQQLQGVAGRAGDQMSDSIATGILEGFRKGSNFGDIFLAELKAQFAKTILSPILRPTVDAGNEFIGSILRSLGGFLGTRNPLQGATGFGDYNSTAVLSGARANGGPVAPGGAYLVGERGPEILRMGRQGGTVVPNSAIGGVSFTLAPNIQIDARSDQAQVAQLVASGMAQAQRGVFEELQKRGLVR